MTAHVIAAPEPTPATDPRGAWLRLSAAFTDAVTDLADREDLTVTCAPGMGRGAPGCFIPDLATVELDGAHLGHAPHTCDPSRPSDRERYPALWGVLVHEAAHAHHTRWSPPNGTPAAHADAALVLEESRIEAAQIRRRPADRHWLRASATHLVLADFMPPAPAPATVPGAGATATPPTTPTPAMPAPSAEMTPWDAGRAAGLLLARVDAGVLDRDEVAPLAAVVTKILGASRLSALSALWHIVHATGDGDQEKMIDLGRRWCRIVGVDPDRPAPQPSPGASGEASGSSPSPLAEAIGGALTAVATAEGLSTSGTPDTTGRSVKADERRREQATRDKTRRAAHRVFGATHPDHGRRGPTAITGTRTPRPDEQAAARRLARRLRAAAHRERLTTVSTSPTPPGRLRMRAALAADAQRAAGSVPTAEPFTQTTRRHVPAPPLRIGIACDVSGSMMTLAAPVASAAWILARAASHVPDARSATVIFGAKVRPVTYPGRTPERVSEFSAHDSTEQFVEAVEALDGTLELSRPGAARLLVVVSDGIFTAEQRRTGQQRIDRLTGTGCAVLWLALSGKPNAMNGAHLVALSDPAKAADTIGAAATRALRLA
ncbi:hypothetical protein GCM10010191_89330 [Actinomadura vinacea]|uniref:VWA domain-containing protein n=1 Tax=Actinomadura vinacea TaxID=115336 RepID=A0ABN3KG90_9ACTN